MTRQFWFDTETFPLRAGLAAPRLVCLQWAYDDDAPTITLAKDAVDVMLKALADPDVLCTGHNSSFDYAVLAAYDERLIQPIFKMLAEGRGRDTMIRETLEAIADGSFFIKRKQKGSFALGTIAKKRCGIELDKGEESWRTRYALLDGIPVESWPEAAVKYALEDITSLRAVSAAQTYRSPDEGFQTAAAFALALCAVWGLKTDAATIFKVETALLTQKYEAEKLLEAAGLFKEGVVNKKEVQSAVERACSQLGKPVPKTAPSKKFPEGQTQTTKDVIDEVGEAEPTLRVLRKKTKADYDLSHYIFPMKGGVRHAMNSRPNVLIESGRTSWGGGKLRQTNPWWKEGSVGLEETNGMNLQNAPRAGGIRDCAVPREGFWWLSTDYDTFELRTLAQSCLWIVGKSVLASRFRSDVKYDPHTELAGHILGISYDEAMRRKALGDKDIKEKRQMAKAANFGYMGGLGARRMLEYAAKEPYNVTLTLEQSTELKEQWFQVFPEMRLYFEYINYLVTAKNGVFRSFVSGMLRGDTGFCDGSNHYPQNLAALAAKAGLIAVSMACYAEPDSPLYRSRPLILVHDEICAETPIETAHEAALEMVRLMESEAQKVCPDVPIKATPALSTRWLKAAEPKHDTNGRLTAWDLP